MIYGYARVSTDGQSVDAQVCQLCRVLGQLGVGGAVFASRAFRLDCVFA